MEFSDPADIREEPNWTLLLGRGRGKSDPRSHLRRRAGNEKKTDNLRRCLTTMMLQIKFVASLLPFARRWETPSDRRWGSHRGGFSVCSCRNQDTRDNPWCGETFPSAGKEMILETSPPWSGCPWRPAAPPTHCPKYSICYSTVGTAVDTLSSFTAPMITAVLGGCAHSVNNAHFRNRERTNTQINGAISPISQMIQWWSEWGLGQRLFFWKKKQAL